MPRVTNTDEIFKKDKVVVDRPRVTDHNINEEYMRDAPHNVDHSINEHKQSYPVLKEGPVDRELTEMEALPEHGEATGRIKKEVDLAERAQEDSVHK